jgi:hypothetical protein
VTLRGADLEGVNRLWFDHPAIQATHVKDLTFRVVPAPDVPLGLYDVRAVGSFGVSNPRAFAVGGRPEASEIEPNDRAEAANRVSVNTVVNGELGGTGDIDCFVLEGRKGQRLFLDVWAERIDSRLDATLRVLGPGGTEVSECRDFFGPDPFLEVVLPADGRYVVKLHDAAFAGSADHFYRLAIHDGPHLEAVLPQAAKPGTTARFRLTGRGLGRGPEMEVGLSPEGGVLESTEVVLTVPAEEALAGTSEAPGRMLVRSAAAGAVSGVEHSFVRPSPSGSAPAVSERILIGRAEAPVILEREPNNDDARAQDVAPPCDISASFAVPGDADVFRFRGKKAEVWWVEAVAERQGSSADPSFVIQKVGSKGEPAGDLASADDLADAGAGARFNTQGVDAALRWQVPEDGLYQVVVSDLFASQRGHPRLTYRLLIRRERPDFTLVLLPNSASSADSVTVRAGGRASAYVLALRKDGFGGAIRVEATELPPGVRAMPVTIGPAQALAPIVFEAAEDAKTGLGTVHLAGRAHFGDRKEHLAYVAGATPLGPDVTRRALAGGMTWPPGGAVPAVAAARVQRGFVMAVRGEAAPLCLTAGPAEQIVAQGHRLMLDVSVARRAGFVEAVAVAATDLPPNVPAASVTIAKEARSSRLPLFVPGNVPPGIYTFVVRGTGAYPFSKDPSAKQKPNVTLTEPSNPVTVTVRPAPVTLGLDNKGGVLKQGARLEVVATIARQNGYAGPVFLALDSPAKLKLAASQTVVSESQNQAMLSIQAAKDSPLGTAADVFVRARSNVRGESIEVEEALALTIAKP